mmetsp:Transcript_46669/g.114467  ORF Transcript_46669/g.114467 Transcript_46669/m.114467 type:complete len:332 (+) Transcript_46669:209-1204(+)
MDDAPDAVALQRATKVQNRRRLASGATSRLSLNAHLSDCWADTLATFRPPRAFRPPKKPPTQAALFRLWFRRALQDRLASAQHGCVHIACLRVIDIDIPQCLLTQFAAHFNTTRFRPQLLFHGTSPSNWASIAHHGLVVPGTLKGVRVVNGSAMGVGIYASPRLSTARSYVRTDSQTVLACVGLVPRHEHAKKTRLCGNRVRTDRLLREGPEMTVYYDARAIIPLALVQHGCAVGKANAAERECVEDVQVKAPAKKSRAAKRRRRKVEHGYTGRAPPQAERIWVECKQAEAHFRADPQTLVRSRRQRTRTRARAHDRFSKWDLAETWLTPQ